MYILPHTTFPEQETPQANDRKNWVRWPRDSSRWFRQNPRLIASIERVSGRNENHHDGRSDYVPGPMDFPVRLRGCTDVDSDVYKCRCQMSTGFPPNVDGNVENISIYHGKKAQKHQNHMLEKCRIICWYIYMYINTQTHTHTLTKRLIFQAFSRGKVQEVRDWLEKMSMLIEKTCKCRTCRCQWFLQMSTWYGRHLCTPLLETNRRRKARGESRGLTQQAKCTWTGSYA